MHATATRVGEARLAKRRKSLPNAREKESNNRARSKKNLKKKRKKTNRLNRNLIQKSSLNLLYLRHALTSQSHPSERMPSLEQESKVYTRTTRFFDRRIYSFCRERERERECMRRASAGSTYAAQESIPSATVFPRDYIFMSRGNTAERYFLVTLW